MRCLIVDDEQLAREILERYIGKTDDLQLAGTCNNALQAFAALNRQEVDVMFLDIKMPEMNGLELIRTLNTRPKIIITTAFHEYALDGFELDVVDYLLKPISFDRFLKAVGKARALIETPGGAAVKELHSDAFYVRSDRKLVKVKASEIIFIEALKNYLSIHTATQKIIVLSTMLHMEEQLKEFSFLHRIHKSFLVNKQFITEIDNGIVRMNTGSEIPLGGLYRDAFLNAMRIL